MRIAEADLDRHAVGAVVVDYGANVALLEHAALSLAKLHEVADPGPLVALRRGVGRLQSLDALTVRVRPGLEAPVVEALGGAGHGLAEPILRARSAPLLEDLLHASGRRVQRRAPAVRAQVDVGSRLAQHLGGSGVTVVGGEHEGRDAVLVRLVQRHAGLDDHRHALGAPAAHGVAQHGGAVLGADLGAGPEGEQLARDVLLALSAGHHQRRGAVVGHVVIRRAAALLKALAEVLQRACAAVLEDLVALLHP
mmetsp:Transcript_73359/g.215147  ORF Transcript_73359/g.215147 Transcript_73359/m.215147 type:complete len:252 (+) Transcript_73359:1486-2241(+)